MITLGVLADTHVPDRASALNPRILEIFAGAGVAAILHAGDVCVRPVLEQLGRLAPVHAVRGNRDLLLPDLPAYLNLTFEQVTLTLTHGHGSLPRYLVERAYFKTRGYRLERFADRLLNAFPQAKVIVFGHTHYTANHWTGNRLVFNPGSAHFPDQKSFTPTVGLLQIGPGGEVKAEIVPVTD